MYFLIPNEFRVDQNNTHSPKIKNNQITHIWGTRSTKSWINVKKIKKKNITNEERN